MTIIGLDIGGSNIKIGTVEKNVVKNFQKVPTFAEKSKEIILNQITSAIDLLFDDRVEGIGVGYPSLVKPNGTIYSAPNVSLENFNLREFLEKKYRVPVQVANDADCFLLGEWHFGNAKDEKNVACITLGTGLGGGIIHNSKHITEKNYSVSEFGRIPMRNQDIEFYCSSKFFAREGTSGEKATERAEAGDIDALNLFKEFGKNLDEALPLIFEKYRPNVLIIGGSLAKASKFYKMFLKTDVKIVFSELEYSTILGASTLVHQ